MRSAFAHIEALGAGVLAVAQARPELLSAFLADEPLPFPLVADPSREGYRHFGLERATWRSFLRPGVLLRYLGLILRGHRPRRGAGGEDVLQLGGDFVLDAAGRLRYAYRSVESTDRPPIEELLEALRRLGTSVAR